MDKKKRVGQIKEQFDLVIHSDETAKIEFWYARDLMSLLGYERWGENFDKAIGRAMESCKTSGIEVSDHFREVTKMIETGKGARRPVKDYMLTRYACYLIAQKWRSEKRRDCLCSKLFCRADQKTGVNRRTNFFLIERTEARGRLRESEKRLSQNIYERGVDDAGFGRIRSKGDRALFGGFTQEMKERLGVKTIAHWPISCQRSRLLQNLAAEMTNYNVEEKRPSGRICDYRHVQNNLSAGYAGSAWDQARKICPLRKISKNGTAKVKSQEKSWLLGSENFRAISEDA